MATMADDDLARIVAQALTEAREKGLEDVDQTGHAVRAVLQPGSLLAVLDGPDLQQG